MSDETMEDRLELASRPAMGRGKPRGPAESERTCRACKRRKPIGEFPLKDGWRRRDCGPCCREARSAEWKAEKASRAADSRPMGVPGPAEVARRTAAMRAAKLEWMRNGGGISLPRRMARTVDLEGGR